MLDVVVFHLGGGSPIPQLFKKAKVPRKIHKTNQILGTVPIVFERFRRGKTLLELQPKGMFMATPQNPRADAVLPWRAGSLAR